MDLFLMDDSLAVLKKQGTVNSTKGFRLAPETLINGADERNRTSDLLITNQLLYQLSYISASDILAKFLLCKNRLAISPAMLS
jgi:hypothetical protein